MRSCDHVEKLKLTERSGVLNYSVVYNYTLDTRVGGINSVYVCSAVRRAEGISIILRAMIKESSENEESTDAQRRHKNGASEERLGRGIIR